MSSLDIVKLSGCGVKTKVVLQKQFEDRRSSSTTTRYAAIPKI